MPERTCSIEKCEKPAEKRGWCGKHYRRWRTHGDPLGGGPDRGSSMGYHAVHIWMRHNFPPVGRCEFCATTVRRTVYASIGHTYTRNRTDWFELCDRCHKAFDGFDWRKLEPGRHQREKTHCKQGHPFDDENTHRRANGHRECRVCMRDRSRRYRAAAKSA